MEWKKVKLGEVAEIYDCPHTTAPDEGAGYPLIRTPNIGEGRFLLNGVHRVCEEVYNQRNKRAIPQNDDLIFAREAPIGNVAIIKNNQKFCLGQRTVLIRSNSIVVCPEYLCYHILSPMVRGRLLNNSNGSTVNHLNVNTIKSFPLSLPPLPIQKKISGILSAYDDLIENYQKQIKLLEESAQRIYKEWFVDFRFPGHENTKFIDGLPQGWERKKIGEIAEIQYGYAFNGMLFNNKGIGNKIIRIRNIPNGTSNDYSPEKVPEKYKVQNGDILVGMDGEFHINTWNDNTAYLVQRSCNIIPKKEILRGWLLQAIYEPIKFFEKTISGATVGHLSKKHLDSIELIIPNNEKIFEILNNLLKQKTSLKTQINHLKESRNILLPRLMNGEISVE